MNTDSSNNISNSSKPAYLVGDYFHNNLYTQLSDAGLYSIVLTMLNIRGDNSSIRNALREMPVMQGSYTVGDVLFAYYQTQIAKLWSER